jgi:hypothetical protein
MSELSSPPITLAVLVWTNLLPLVCELLHFMSTLRLVSTGKSLENVLGRGMV